MTEETNVPIEEPKAADAIVPSAEVPAGAQVPGVDVTTGIPDGLTDAKQESKPEATIDVEATEVPAPEAPINEAPAAPENDISEAPAA